MLEIIGLRTPGTYSRAGVRAGPAPAPWFDRWWGRLALVLASVLALTLAFAPFYQFYLAWIGLVPWLIVVRRARSAWAAFLWSSLAGTLFFLANMWWLAFVTVPGMIALLIYLGLFWGWVALIYRLVFQWDADRTLTMRKARAVGWVLLSGAGWCGVEWVRGNWSIFGNEGLPWLYLGYTQSPLLVMCQVADLLGVSCVSFWVFSVNAVIALWISRRFSTSKLIPTFATVAVLLLAIAMYGFFRLREHKTFPGPVVLVVQPNYPQDNSGGKGASEAEIVSYHLNQTAAALDAAKRADTTIDLIAWSETMMPPINERTRDFFRAQPYGDFIDRVVGMIQNLVWEHNAALVTGGGFAQGWRETGAMIEPTDRRNSTYFFRASGLMSELRYDKVHLVPFGEFVPFKHGWPWLYRQLIALGPPDMEAYGLERGNPTALTVFSLSPSKGENSHGARFVTPICFEDIDGDLLARMFQPDASGKKRADFIVNVTNDGWFAFNENAQHLQAALFRSIEVRAPTARSVNTGISGFIDSTGHVGAFIPPRTAGTSFQRIELDRRVSLYSRIGDAFPRACAALTALLVVARTSKSFFNRIFRESEVAIAPQSNNSAGR